MSSIYGRVGNPVTATKQCSLREGFEVDERELAGLARSRYRCGSTYRQLFGTANASMERRGGSLVSRLAYGIMNPSSRAARVSRFRRIFGFLIEMTIRGVISDEHQHRFK